MKNYYDIKNLRWDIIGGLVAGIVALPLALAFGVQSGLGAVSGLYGAIAVGILAALFGGTATQASGPTGPITVISAALVAAAINYTGSLESALGIILITFLLGGVFQILFCLVLALFLLLGWQGHQPVTTIIILEVFAGGLAGLAITWIGRKLDIPAFKKDGSLLMAGLRTGLLLFPALLLWPRDILAQPLLLGAALGLAALVIGLSYMALLFYFPKTSNPY
jgi:hypothetical protein